MTTAIIDYGSGNLRSAAKAFERAASVVSGAGPVVVTADPECVAAADRIVLPGVGAFADCMAGLAAVSGMIAALREAVERKGRPFFGICVGMQLMARAGLEHGRHDGFGWIDGEVVRIFSDDEEDEIDAHTDLKVPHMGWNELVIRGGHPLFDGVPAGGHAYFVHSYHLRPADPMLCLAEVDYGGAITAAVGRDNMVGTQFHPEKSQAVGLKLIENFLSWRP